MTKDKLAFETHVDRGFQLKVYYLVGDQGDALVELYYNNEMVREMMYPAYKIWNLAAHFKDIVDGELSASDSEIGYRIAGATGFGGVVMPTNVEPPTP
jgi:hypothetical protein